MTSPSQDDTTRHFELSWDDVVALFVFLRGRDSELPKSVTPVYQKLSQIAFSTLTIEEVEKLQNAE